MVCSNVYPPGFVGGAELVAHNQAKMLQELGQEVLVFGGDVRGHGSRHEMSRDVYEGINVCRIRLVPEDFNMTSTPFAHPEVEAHFISLLHEFKPDVVHFHNVIGLSVKIIALAKEFGCRTVLSVHDHWGYCLKNTILRDDGSVCKDFSKCDADCMSHITQDGKIAPYRFRKDFFTLMFSHVDLVIAASDYLAKLYEPLAPNRVRAIEYGTAVDRYKNLEKKADNKVRFTFVGIFSKHKGVQLILESLLYIKNREKIQINLIGDGEELENYREFIEENKLSEYVNFRGKVPYAEISNVYAETDVLLLPSVWPENQPQSVTEAMACRIPAIVSDGGGSKELIKDGARGYVFETGNVEQLVQKMQNFIDNPELSTELGNNAFRFIKECTHEKQMGLVINEYNRLLNDERHLNEYKIIATSSLLNDTTNVSYLNNLKLDNGYLIIHEDWLTKEQANKSDAVVVLDEHSNIECIYDQMISNKVIFALVSNINTELRLLGQFSNGLVLAHSVHELGTLLSIYIDQPALFNEYKSDMWKYIMPKSKTSN